jgi:Flp pilus assembly protein TadG
MTLRAGRDDGAATIFMLTLSVVLFVVAGLVVDGGLAINARGRVADDAEQAARAGAQQVDLDRLRTDGVVVLDAPAARTASADFLTARGYTPGTATPVVAGDTVTVTVRRREPTAMLLLIGIDHFDVEATASSRPVLGIAGAIP